METKFTPGPWEALKQVIKALDERARRLERERDALREVLQRYMSAYPAFRMKPIGAEGSPARIEQENLMALEEAAKAALSATEGGGK